MSYILEALRKADAQRERNRVPGLHAHPLAAEAAVPAQRWGGSVMAALAAVGVVAAIAITWWLASPDASVAPAAERVAAAPPAVQEPAPVAAAAPAPAPAPPEPANAIVPSAPPPLPPPAQPRVERPAPREAKAAASAPVAQAAVPAASAVPTAAPAAPAIANAPPPGLPPMAVSGGVYSQNPAQRMLIVNGQVFNEGSEIASGVRLEEVRADKKAVLNFNGQRFALPY